MLETAGSETARPETAGSETAGNAQLLLQLDGFEGPLDLLLDLARGQKVDLARISILALVEQYLAVVEGARRIRLELAADWLVMAAWLAWLKSRLLLPPEATPDIEAEDAAQALAARLEDLRHVQRGAQWLAARPQLGLDVHPRGAPERFIAFDRSTLAADLPGLVRAYMAARRRGGTTERYTPRRLALWTVADAMARLHRLLGRTPPVGWTALDRFLPTAAATPIQRRAAVASTLMAGLELARDGTARLRQDTPWAPILIGGPHAT